MRIALWGAFDVEDCGLLATPRVIEAELRRRLPGAAVTVCAPLGRLRPLALDGGRAAEPLAESVGRMDGVAARFDCILVCGEDTLVSPERAAELWGGGDPAAAAGLLVDGLGAGLEAVCPVVWAGVSLPGDPDPQTAERIRAAAPRRAPVTALDRGSRRRLAAAGVPGDIELLPPPALLLPRILGGRLLASRARLLRLMGWAWEQGPVLTVQGDGRLLDRAGAIARDLGALTERGEASVQLAVSGRHGGEEAFADALEGALGERCRRLPGVAAIEDLAAVIAASSAFLGPPGVGLWLAAALGVPAASPVPGSDENDHAELLDELGVPRLTASGLAAGIRRMLAPGAARPAAATAVARLDRRLDGLAGLVGAAASRRATAAVAPDDAQALREAHHALGLRLFAERRAFQSAQDGAVRDLEAELHRVRAELDATRAANQQMAGSRTWRYSQPLRDVRARLREGRG